MPSTSPDWQLVLGPLGALVLAVLVGSIIGKVLWNKLNQKDVELAQEHAARLTDAKQYADSLLKMAEGTHQAVNRLEVAYDRLAMTSGTRRQL